MNANLINLLETLPSKLYEEVCNEFKQATKLLTDELDYEIESLRSFRINKEKAVEYFQQLKREKQTNGLREK